MVKLASFAWFVLLIAAIAFKPIAVPMVAIVGFAAALTIRAYHEGL